MLTNLRKLAYIVTVADSGSITKAALRLNISQPALSLMIKASEEEFGFQIFIRNRSQGVTLTSTGRGFVSRARRLLDDARQFQMEATGLADTLSGVVEVACFSVIAPYIIPPIIRAFSKRFSDILVNVHEGDLVEVLMFLKSGVAEVAITYDMYLDTSVTFEPLTDLAIQVGLSVDDPLARQSSIRIKQLEDKPMILLDYPVTEVYFQNLLRNQGIEPKVECRTKTTQMIRSMVAAGEGFALFLLHPKGMTTTDGSELTYVPLETTQVPPKLGLAFPSQFLPTRTIKTFAAECRSIVQSQKALDSFLMRPKDRTLG